MKYLPRAVADGKLRALVKGAEIVRGELNRIARGAIHFPVDL